MPEYEHVYEMVDKDGTVEIPDGAIGVTPDTFGDCMTVHYLKPVDSVADDNLKARAEVQELRDRIADLVTSDAIESGSSRWQKLEAAETALDWALGENDGFEGLIERYESEGDDAE
jgi:hypothetical protein